jgi:trehalose 2-sulfotransferase
MPASARSDDRPSDTPFYVSSEWDQPGPFVPERSFLIATVPRTGSSLVAGVLRATEALGVPFEYFNPIALGAFGARFGVPKPTVHARVVQQRRKRAGKSDWRRFTEARPGSVPAYIDRLHQYRSSATGAFGLKLHWEQMRRFEKDSRVNLLDLLAPRQVVFMTRRDHERQAISFYRARRTKVWSAPTSGEGPTAKKPEATFDATAIREAVQRIEQVEASWRAELARRGLPVHEVVYEDVDTDYEPVLRECFRFLGEPDLAVPEQHLERQADEVTEEWVMRLREEA